MLTAGVDAGSRNLKVALVRDGAVAALASGTGGEDSSASALALLDEALRAAGAARDELAAICATGMGRDSITFADRRVTDITAAAVAAAHFFPGAETVAEVGAEEARAILTDGAGRVLDSAVNARCAAGSGSFAESMARALSMDLADFSRESMKSEARIEMNAQCTVFAESEVVSLIHQNIPKGDIARAVNDAIAARVGILVRRVGLRGRLVLLGGMACNEGFCSGLAENLSEEKILVPEKPDCADAVGAALYAARRAAGGKRP